MSLSSCGFLYLKRPVEHYITSLINANITSAKVVNMQFQIALENEVYCFTAIWKQYGTRAIKQQDDEKHAGLVLIDQC